MCGENSTGGRRAAEEKDEMRCDEMEKTERHEMGGMQKKERHEIIPR
jgi:hypothetical protein